MAKNSYLKASVGYSIGNLLIRGISFLTLPIFSRIMDASDFGLFSAVISIASVLCLVMNFAVHVAIPNARVDYPNKLDEFGSSMVWFTIILAVPYLIASLLFSEQLGELLGIPGTLVLIAVLESVGMALLSIFANQLAQNYRYKEYIIVSFLYTLINAGLSIILILTAYSEHRYMGRLVGGIAAIGALSAYVIITFFLRSKPANNKKYWPYALRISVPIVPHGISQVLIAQVDRVMLLQLSSSASAGLYSFSFTIASLFQILFASLETTWTPWFFGRMKAKDSLRVCERSNILIALATVVICAGMVVAPELVTIVGGENFVNASGAVIPIVASMFFGYLFSFVVGVQYYYKKTVYIALVSLSVALMKVGVNSYIIPRYGYSGAAYTSLFVYVVYFLLHYAISRCIHRPRLFNNAMLFGSSFFVILWTLVLSMLVENALVRYALLLALIAPSGAYLHRHWKSVLNAFSDQADEVVKEQ
ncbi:MAG: lipopolysaccharide biosynthesis protein [Christensenellales bacterium]|jgi:O-antigen/teichoic acid export membrane protein